MAETRCILGVVPVQSPHILTIDEMEMEDFGLWLFIDLASRTGRRGRPQKQPMTGVFCSRTFGRNPGVPQKCQLRGTDFSLRVGLWVEGWCRTGMTILEACRRASEVELVKARLSKPKRGRRPKIPGGGKQEVDETVHTCYYAVQKRFDLEHLFPAYWNWFLEWRKWIVSADKETLSFVAGLYRQNGQIEGGDDRFLEFASRLQGTSPPRKPH